MVEGKEAIIANIKEKPWQASELLRKASPDLKEDVGFVTEAVKHNGLALRWASEELKKNQAVVLAAVKNNGWAIEHVDLIGVSEREPKDRVIIIIHAYKNVKEQDNNGIEGSLVAFMDFLERVVAKDGQQIINSYKQLNNIEKDDLLDNKAMGKKKKKGTKKKKSPKKRKGTKKKKAPKKKNPPKKKKAPKKKKGPKKRKGTTRGMR